MKRLASLSRLEVLIFTGLLILAAAVALSWQLSRPDRVQTLAEEMAGQYHITHYFETFDGLLHDDIEKDPRYLAVAAAVDSQVQDHLRTYPTGHPFPTGQSIKQDLLKKDHGIEWRTTSQMNPWDHSE